MPSMSETAKIIFAVVGTGLAVGGWVSMSIGEVRQDIRDIRADIRQVSAIAKADSDKNNAQLAAHLTSHAAPKSSEAE